MNRRFGAPPEKGTYYPPRPGAYAVIIASGGVLVTFQEEPTPEFQLPGGGIDPGEAVIPALHREVFEETGYSIHVPRRVGMYHRFVYMPEYRRFAQKQCQVYLARAGRRLGPPSEAGHHALILPWEDAAERLASRGGRHFLKLVSARLDQYG